MNEVKDELDHFKEKFSIIKQIFLSKKVRSGTVFPDPT
jgi:hypothetical protein